ncbi:MAG: hypothetical protein ACI9MR_000858 [Myxococcota bacterium]|jgi:hypothetical protein
MYLKSSIIAALVVLGGISTAQAAPHTHDGFLLRLAAGAGYESLSLDTGVQEVTIGGLGIGLSIGIGGMVVPNLAINADLFGAVVVSPNVEVNGVDIGEARDSSVSLSALGVGFTYYIMPANIYVALSLGFGATTITVEGSSFESDAGFAVNAMLGKEFWVGKNWGIGIAGQFIFADVPTTSDAASASFISANLMFTATYN